MITVGIIAIGDELCIGQVVNTNASFIAAECTNAGASVVEHRVVSDQDDVIISTIHFFVSEYDVVVVSGGLGPTHDDRTKAALLNVFTDVEALHEPTLQHITEMFAQRGRELTDRNKQQAMLPSKCTPLFNSLGTAPGMKFSTERGLLFSLPGVPAEMMQLMQRDVAPLVKAMVETAGAEFPVYRSFQTVGIAESNLADLLSEFAEQFSHISLAYLPSYYGVRLRIGVISKSRSIADSELNAVSDYLFSSAGKWIVAEGDVTVAEVVVGTLHERGLTVAVAESCTGGLLGGALTDVSGSSAVFLGGVQCYSNQAKHEMVGVGEETLEAYGAVSEQVAIELAENARLRFRSDIAVSITGIAGPSGGTQDKPVGLIWIGCSTEKNTKAVRYLFGTDRFINRQRAVAAALVTILNESSHL